MRAAKPPPILTSERRDARMTSTIEQVPVCGSDTGERRHHHHPAQVISPIPAIGHLHLRFDTKTMSLTS